MSFLQDYDTDDQRWTAIRNRDIFANSAFYYGVITTRIFCRPTCLGRVARRANIIFFNDLKSAKHSSYRACKKCQPENQKWSRGGAGISIIEQGQMLIEEAVSSSNPWTINGISSQIGITAAHFHRLFKKHSGVTPKEFAVKTARDNHTEQDQAWCDFLLTEVTGLDSSTQRPDATFASRDWSVNQYFDYVYELPVNSDENWYNQNYYVLPQMRSLNPSESVQWEDWLRSEESHEAAYLS